MSLSVGSTSSMVVTTMRTEEAAGQVCQGALTSVFLDLVGELSSKLFIYLFSLELKNISKR